MPDEKPAVDMSVFDEKTVAMTGKSLPMNGTSMTFVEQCLSLGLADAFKKVDGSDWSYYEVVYSTSADSNHNRFFVEAVFKGFNTGYDYINAQARLPYGAKRKQRWRLVEISYNKLREASEYDSFENHLAEAIRLQTEKKD